MSMSSDDFFGSILPNSLKPVAEVIGRDGAVKLVSLFGGTRIFVPKRVKKEHRLAIAIGHRMAKALSKEFGGESIQVVRGAQELRQRRNREILRQYNAGESVASLARKFSLSERRVYDILGKG